MNKQDKMERKQIKEESFENTKSSQQQFECKMCQKNFGRPSSLKRHMNSHETSSSFAHTYSPTTQSFQCDLCPKHFRQKLTLKLHRINTHKVDVTSQDNFQSEISLKIEDILNQQPNVQNDIDKYDNVTEELPSSPAPIFILPTARITSHICNTCEKTFSKKSSLDRHMELHNVKRFNCSKCDKRFDMKSKLDEHLSLHEISQDEPFKCEKCQLRFPTRRKCTKHFINVHRFEKSLVCPHCAKSFSTKYHLQRHVLSHINQNNPSSSKNEIIQAVPMEIENHPQIIPDEPEDQEQAFKIIGYENQTNASNSEIIQAVQMENHPQIPNGTYDQEGIFKISNKRRKKEKQKNAPSPKNSSSNSKPKCPICSKTFNKEFNFQKHVQLYEKKISKKDFVCEKCDKRFAVELNLKLHLQYHTNQMTRPFICETCEVTFVNQGQLDRHLKKHSKNHPCPFCQKVFTRQEHLARHIRVNWCPGLKLKSEIV